MKTNSKKSRQLVNCWDTIGKQQPNIITKFSKNMNRSQNINFQILKTAKIKVFTFRRFNSQHLSFNLKVKLDKRRLFN